MQVDELFDQIDTLPHVPDVVLSLMRAVNDPDARIAELAAQVSRDQALSLRVLKMVNSAYFGLSRKCGSIHDAVVLLGLTRLRSIVLASALVKAIPPVEGLNLPEFWRHTFRVASHARWFAKQGRSDPEQAFAAGLLHNLGGLLVYLADGELAREIEKRLEAGEPIDMAETGVLGFTTPEAGAELLARWHFPKELSEAIRHQRHPLQGDDCIADAGAIFLADIAGDISDTGGTVDDLLDAMPRGLLHSMDILEVDLAEHAAEALELDYGLEALLEA
jgi:HD-like signal output (HDOD) protein